MALTKAKIVKSITEKAPMPSNEALNMVELLIETIKRTLESGDDVLISGFGKFCVKEKHERRGRNPATGDSLILKPRRVVTFKSSGILRDKINS